MITESKPINIREIITPPHKTEEKRFPFNPHTDVSPFDLSNILDALQTKNEGGEWKQTLSAAAGLKLVYRDRGMDFSGLQTALKDRLTTLPLPLSGESLTVAAISVIFPEDAQELMNIFQHNRRWFGYMRGQISGSLGVVRGSELSDNVFAALFLHPQRLAELAEIEGLKEALEEDIVSARPVNGIFRRLPQLGAAQRLLFGLEGVTLTQEDWENIMEDFQLSLEEWRHEQTAAMILPLTILAAHTIEVTPDGIRFTTSPESLAGGPNLPITKKFK